MPYIAEYLLKLSLSLSVVYLFYILVLRRQTFYNWNRWYLLGYSVLAFFIPFVNISPVLKNGAWDKNVMIQFIPMFSGFNISYHNAVDNAGFTWWWALLLGAVAGVLLMMVRFLVRYISYHRIRKSAELLVDGCVKVYHVNKSIIPFSFGNAIFINRQLHEEADLEQIIHHEFIHVKQRHTIDIMWGELLCMLNWYNPFAWMLRKAIRQNLEFIADHKVLENGIDKKHYQYLLLKVTGVAHFSITQQFNFSSLKKRIIMMNRSRSAKIQLTRFLFLLPLVTILLLAFRSNVIDQKRSLALKEVTLQQLKLFVAQSHHAIVDTIPSKTESDKAYETFLKKNPDLKNVYWQGAVNSFLVVHRKDGIEEKYQWNDEKARQLFNKRYGKLPENLPANILILYDDEVTDTVNLQVDASLDGPGNPNLPNVQGNVLFVIDGLVKKKGFDQLRDIAADNIKTINVLKGLSGVAKYGDAAKGKEGVIEIETKEYTGSGKNDTINIIADSVVFSGKPTIIIKGNNSFKHDVNLYVVDGIEFSPAEFDKLNIDPDRIESITILKDASAVKLYGEKARRGVIIVKLKKPLTLNEEPWDSDRIKALFKGSDQVIWIVEGNTYAVASGKGNLALARAEGAINTIMVNGKLYTAAEANRLFKQSQFTGAGVLDERMVYKLHGISVPAMVLIKDGAELDKYQTLYDSFSR